MCSVLVLLAISSAAVAEDDIRSDCGPDTRAMTLLRVELKPWFAEINHKFKTAIEAEGNTALRVKGLAKNKPIVCFVKLKENGEILDEKIVQPGGPEDLSMIRDLIHDKAAFRSPPNKLPQQKGVRIQFSSDGNNIDVSSGLSDCWNQARIGQIRK